MRGLRGAVWRGQREPVVRRIRKSCIIMMEPLEQRHLLSADLTGAFTTPFPALLPAGDTIRTTVRVQNQGDAPAAGPVRVELYASADGSLDVDDSLLGSAVKNTRLRSGGSALLRLRFVVPPHLADGSYELLARISSGDAAPSSPIAAPAPVQVRQPLVDLSARLIAVPGRPVGIGKYGGKSIARVQILNGGNIATLAPVAVSLYLSSDTTLDSNDQPIGMRKHIRSIGPGSAKSPAVEFFPPASTVPGSYYLLAVVDSLQAVAESDETNNLAVAPVPIQIVQTPPRHRDDHHHHEYGYYDDTGAFIDTGYYDSGYYYDGSGGYDDSSSEESSYDQPTSQPSDGYDDSDTGDYSSDDFSDSTGEDF